MKSLRIFVCLIGLLTAPLHAEAIRETINLNRDWKFQLGDQPGSQASAFDDTNWTAVNLPHSFSMPYFGWKDFYVGLGWYRRHLNIPARWTSKRVNLEFEGAFQVAEVFVNGSRIGQHQGGFTGFSYDVTNATHAGDNVLAVRVNNNWDARIEPRAGDHTFMGGIYRDVHLVVTDPLHVTWYGTFITTPKVSKESATLNIKTEIANQSDIEKSFTLQTDILDPSGKIVMQVSTRQHIAAGATVTMEQVTSPLASPKLWSPARPVMYSAVSHILDTQGAVDDYTTPFGIRWVKWTADQGFFINDEHLYFHGANVHQDHAGWGDAVTDYGTYRDVKLVKDAGLDFIRGSHYPHHPAFADACDRLGVLFWSENCFWGCGNGKAEGYWNAAAYPPNAADQPAFEQNALDTLRDEIRIFRNHPSIIVWSMCNEVFFSGNQDKVRGLLKKLVAEAHELDPTRPAAIGGCQRGDLDKLGDVAGYNGDGSRLKQFQNPGIANAVSEYGSHVSDRGDPRTDHYDGMFLKKELNVDTPEYPWRSGQSLWCAFDYSTVLGHFGCMGFVDYFRIPKRSWYWYRNQYLHIAPPDWPIEGTPDRLSLSADKTTIQGTDAIDDCQLLVTVMDANGKWISNSPPVTFTIESGPGEFPTGRSITFNPPSKDPASDIAIRDGLAAIEFRSYFAGKTVIRATSPGLKDSSIAIITDGEPVFIPGQSPIAPQRPYVRFVRTAPGDQGPINLAPNHPVSASSESPDHPARFANDGNPNTGWLAADNAPGAWWQIDMEGLNTIDAVEIHFADEAEHRYKLEASLDGTTWALLADQTKTHGIGKVRRDNCAANNHMRYLRLTVTGDRAQVQEIEIFGRPSL